MLCWTVQLSFAAWLHRRVQQVLAGVERRSRDLALLAGVLRRLEEATFTAPRLRELHARLDGADGVPPSQRIAQLGNLLDLLDSRRNQYLSRRLPSVLWSTQLALAIEAWRRAPARHRRLAGGRGRDRGPVALAAYAAENPADPFPEVVEEGPSRRRRPGPPALPGTRLHPQRPEPGRRPAGWSSAARTCRARARCSARWAWPPCIALAGLPVRAGRLRLSPLAVGATLRIQDSLQAGRSRFYAEITRVRQIVDLSAGPLPLLFLFDELFHGTNSHDRAVGAEAVIRGLIDRGAIGLVTTHDLSLARIADDRAAGGGQRPLRRPLRERGQMQFDYLIHPGVVGHSNALALMRGAVGLEGV